MRKKGLLLALVLLVSLIVLPLVTKAAPEDIPDLLGGPGVVITLGK